MVSGCKIAVRCVPNIFVASARSWCNLECENAGGAERRHWAFNRRNRCTTNVECAKQCMLTLVVLAGLILAPVRIIWELGLMAKGKARVLFGGVHSANSVNTTDTDEPEPPSAFDQNMTMPEQILKDLRRAVRRLYRSIFTSRIEWALGLVWNAMPSYCYYYL